MNKIKKVSILLLIVVMLLNVFSINVFASEEEPTNAEIFEEMKNTIPKSNYDLYIGEILSPFGIFENSYAINRDTFEVEGNEIYGYLSTSDSNIALEEDAEFIIAKKVGKAIITISLTYKEEKIEKSFMVTVKQSTGSTKLDSSVNDVKNIIGNKVLLANGELWTLDSKCTKLKSRYASNVKKYYNSISHTDGSESMTSKMATVILKNNGILSIKTENQKIKVKNVKDFFETGFITKKGEVYKFDFNKKGNIIYKKIAKGATKILNHQDEGILYVKNKKTYNQNNKLFFKGIIKYIDNYCFVTNDGTLYNLSKEKITTKKVKSILGYTDWRWGEPVFKATNGNIYKVDTFGETEKVKSEKIKYIELSDMFDNLHQNYLNLETNNKLYLNSKQILDNVKAIYKANIEDTALIVRKDGSIWKLELGDNPSLIKIRSGKMSYKKISKPTKLKAKKSGKTSSKITWNKVEGASKYTVYRSTNEKGTYKKIGTSKTNSYLDKTTKNKKTYYYKVVANHTDKNYNSAKSDAVKIKIK